MKISTVVIQIGRITHTILLSLFHMNKLLFLLLHMSKFNDMDYYSTSDRVQRRISTDGLCLSQFGSILLVSFVSMRYAGGSNEFLHRSAFGGYTNCTYYLSKDMHYVSNH
jgi:hypothetical protein